jgi:hypothetical protein
MLVRDDIHTGTLWESPILQRRDTYYQLDSLAKSHMFASPAHGYYPHLLSERSGNSNPLVHSMLDRNSIGISFHVELENQVLNRRAEGMDPSLKYYPDAEGFQFSS